MKDKVPKVDDAQVPDVDTLVAELRERIAARERSGDRPPHLDADLAAHFARVVDSTPAVGDQGRLLTLLDRLRTSVQGSGVQGSGVQGSGDQGSGADLTMQVVGELASLLAASETRRANLERRVSHVEHLVDELRREQGGDPQSLGALRRRVEQLESQLPAPFDPPFTAAAFQEHFAGGVQQQWLRHVASQFLGVEGPVLDIGCGRGDLLIEFEAVGVRATGVDLDPSVTAVCRERGVTADLGDGLQVLQRSFDGSLGGVTALQVIEHLDRGRAAKLVELAYRKIEPGGKLLLQTVNVESLFALARAYVIDPTHVHPVHHSYLEFLVASAGFEPVSVEFQSPIPEYDRLVTTPGQSDPNIERLNEVLFAPQDYTVIGVKPADVE